MGIVLDPTKSFPPHPHEEILEEYAFGRLPETLNAPVEEHLLICPSCQDAVTNTDRFRSDLKAAASQPVPAAGPVRSAWHNVRILPRLAAADIAPFLALAILTLVIIWQHPQELPEPATLSLHSMRGTGTLSPAPAGTPLKLSIEAPDLIPGKQYRVEVVDAAGTLVWKGAVTEAEGKLVATMPKRLVRGVYWVRLYGADSEQLREFGMSAR